MLTVNEAAVTHVGIGNHAMPCRRRKRSILKRAMLMLQVAACLVAAVLGVASYWTPFVYNHREHAFETKVNWCGVKLHRARVYFWTAKQVEASEADRYEAIQSVDLEAFYQMGRPRPPVLDLDLRSDGYSGSLAAWAIVSVLAIGPTIAFVVIPTRRIWRHRRGRCVFCGYCLVGLVSRRCPECGCTMNLGKGGLRDGSAT